jgi:hypothetical protein
MTCRIFSFQHVASIDVSAIAGAWAYSSRDRLTRASTPVWRKIVLIKSSNQTGAQHGILILRSSSASASQRCYARRRSVFVCRFEKNLDVNVSLESTPIASSVHSVGGLLSIRAVVPFSPDRTMPSSTAFDSASGSGGIAHIAPRRPADGTMVTSATGLPRARATTT